MISSFFAHFSHKLSKPTWPCVKTNWPLTVQRRTCWFVSDNCPAAWTKLEFLCSLFMKYCVSFMSDVPEFKPFQKSSTFTFLNYRIFSKKSWESWGSLLANVRRTFVIFEVSSRFHLGVLACVVYGNFQVPGRISSTENSGCISVSCLGNKRLCTRSGRPFSCSVNVVDSIRSSKLNAM